MQFSAVCLRPRAARVQGQAGAPAQITEEVSVNADVGADSQPLLSGDADDELQMKDRLIEKQ